MFSILEYNKINCDRELWNSMLRDRAGQFVDRHRWPLTVNEEGLEIDNYDDEFSEYGIISQNSVHLASVRLRPASCGSIVEHHFGSLWQPHRRRLSAATEITRLCSTPILPYHKRRLLISDLMLAACQHAIRNGVDQIFGLVYASVYRLLTGIGCPSEILASEEGKRPVLLALWRPSEIACSEIQKCKQHLTIRSLTPDVPIRYLPRHPQIPDQANRQMEEVSGV